MAVLAGTVAGVTVSQLNKNTDRANGTQAKGIADMIQAEIANGLDISNSTLYPSGSTWSTGNLDALRDDLEEKYGQGIVKVTPATTKDIFSVYAINIGQPTAAIVVTFSGKQSEQKGDVSYIISAEGAISQLTGVRVIADGETALTL